MNKIDEPYQDITTLLEHLQNCKNEEMLVEEIQAFLSSQLKAKVEISLIEIIPQGHLSFIPKYDVKHQEHDVNQASSRPFSDDVTSITRNDKVLKLSFGSEVLGQVLIHKPEESFSEKELAFIEQITYLAGLYAYTFRLESSQVSVKKQIKLIAEVTSQLAHISEIEELLRAASRLIRKTFNFYYAAIFTLEPGSDELIFGASDSVSLKSKPLFETLSNQQIKLGEHMVGYVAQSGKTLLANDVALEPRYYALDALPETEAEIAIPLKVGDSILGVMDIQSDQKNSFSQKDLLVLNILADSIAIAVHRVRLYHSLNDRNEELRAIAELSKSITSVLDLDLLLGKITELIHSEFGYPNVNIFLTKFVPKTIEYRAGSGPLSKAYDERKISFSIHANQGMIPRAVQTGEIQLVNDVSQNEFFQPNPITKTKTGSELSIPLIFGDEVLGVLDIESDLVNAFTKTDVDLIETFCSYVSIAIRNANLYDSQKWRRRVAENLRDVAVLLSQEIDLDQLYQVVLKKIQEILPCDLATIWLLDSFKATESNENPSKLNLAAFRSDDVKFKDAPNININCEDAWFSQAMNEDKTIIRQKDMLKDPIISYYQLPNDCSAVAAPLSIAGKLLGVLVLHEDSHGRYGEDTKGICASFAGYTAVAIQNNQLSIEKAEQTRISTILLQIALATQSLTTIDQLVETIGQLMMTLIGGSSGGLLLKPEDDEALQLVSVFGEEISDLCANLPISIPAHGVFEEILQNREPAASPPSKFDNLFLSILRILPDDTVLLFPLISQEQNLGILIHVSQDQYVEAPPEKVIGAQKFAILRGLAQQTAVTLQNINLLQERQEETYLSNALLQISTLLNDGMEFSERLLNVCKALIELSSFEEIYLFERNLDSDDLSLKHKINRSQVSPPVPILSEVSCKCDKSLLDSLFASSEISFVFPPEWINENLLGTQIDDLQPEETLLPGINTGAAMVLPLQVIEQKYGMLVINDSALPNRNQRIKFLEDTARRISAAYQSEQLRIAHDQQNLMEREFQLARQIQKTFLPEKILHIPGYDIAAYWETARQVGGDFYDVFSINSEYTGFVIADVSDKGLPASLYMTVTRTLIRAVSVESFSPAAILEQVNRLLQLDTSQGFFVTVFYAILENVTGKIVYTIAGHNPPLLFRATPQGIVNLQHGGIALGIMDRITLKDHELNLSHGDTLVMYTDGITESFNIAGDYYGEKRLTLLLEKYSHKSAEELIEIIRLDGENFRAGSAISDDNTLLIVKNTDQ